MRAQQLSHRSLCSHPMRHRLAAVLAGLLAAAPPAGAVTLIWDGSGATDNWNYIDPSGDTNWTNPTPPPPSSRPNNGDTLQFQGTTRLTPNNDQTARSIAGINFLSGAGAFTLNGNAITSTGNISNLSAHPQTITLPILIGADQTWDGGTAGLTVNGTVNLFANHLTLAHQAAIGGNNFHVGRHAGVPAMLTVQSGGAVRSLGGSVGNSSGSIGMATVDGAGSVWNSWTVTVGGSGTGTLTVQNGGTMSNTNGVAYTGGTVTVKDVDSTWTSSGELIVSNGTLNIQNGGAASDNNGRVTGDGTATVTGAGSTWTNSGTLYVGNLGAGTLNIQNGGAVSSAFGDLGRDGTGTVTVDGFGSRWTSSNSFLAGMGGTGTLNIQNGGAVNTPFAYLGYSGGGKGTATVDGAGSTWTNSSTLGIGFNGTGELNIRNGGAASNADGYLGNVSGSTGTATVNGVGSTWTNSGVLYFGFNSGSHGTLNVQNGGVVNSASGSLGSGNGTTGTATVDGAGSKWNNSVSLGVGSFSGTGTLNVQNGGAVSVGGTLYFGSQGKIQLASGAITATQLQLVGGSTLTGHGTVTANVSGGTATTSIQASGGALRLGKLDSTTGFNYGGKLDVGSNRVTLNDRDLANLGISTTLAAGGILDTVNGAVLGAGATLSYAGAAYIGGAFTNNGLVDAAGAGTLTFLNAVDGAGGFGGDIHFHDAYRPGNSPAIIDFHNGDATFDVTSLLKLEIFGAQPGTGYDQLIGIDRLTFTGALDLTFGSGFVPVTGQIFDLFDFTAFSGGFDPARIGVTGFDRARLDFSYLPVNGELRVIAAAQAPLPGTLWLFLWGLGTFLFGRRTLGGHRGRANTLYGAMG